MIYFLETYTGTKIPYSRVHKVNPYGWFKELPDHLRISYDGPEEGEEYEMYVDFVDLLTRYKLQKQKKD